MEIVTKEVTSELKDEKELKGPNEHSWAKSCQCKSPKLVQAGQFCCFWQLLPHGYYHGLGSFTTDVFLPVLGTWEAQDQGARKFHIY